MKNAAIMCVVAAGLGTGGVVVGDEPGQTEDMKLVGDDEAEGFGTSVAVSGTTAVVGADEAAYVFGLGVGPCNAADLVEPFGTLDFGDITAFVGAFATGEAEADLDGNGIYDLGDIVLFVGAFNAGCP